MKFVVILLGALTLVCATPSLKPGKNHNLQPIAEKDDSEVPVGELDHTFEEVPIEIEDKENEDDSEEPVDSPKLHMGLHYLETVQEMQAMGVDTMSINTDLLEDAFLLVVCKM